MSNVNASKEGASPPPSSLPEDLLLPWERQLADLIKEAKEEAEK